MKARRQGHTLTEVVLVAAVLVIVGFISLPMLKPMFVDNRLQAAEDLVRARWAETRSRAISEGRSYRFAVQENSGRYLIAPDSAEFWGEGGEPAGGGPAVVISGALPDDLSFCSPDAATGMSAGGSSNQGWMSAATFLPDGTARENVQVTFTKPGTRTVTLHLNATTGAVSTGTPGVEPRP